MDTSTERAPFLHFSSATDTIEATEDGLMEFEDGEWLFVALCGRYTLGVALLLVGDV